MKRFTIALSGVSDNDASKIRDELAAAEAWQLVDGPTAFLLVVDIDTTWGHMDWLRATAHGQHVAAFTANDNIRDADLILNKPLHLKAFSDLLRQLEDVAEHRAKPGEATNPASKTQPAATAPKPKADITPVVQQPQANIDSRPIVEADQVKAASQAPAPVIDPPASTPAPVVKIPEPEPEPEPAPEPAPPMTLREALLANAVSQPVSFQGHGVELYLDPERGGYTGPAKLVPLQDLLDLLIDSAQALDEAATLRMREASALPLTRLLWFAALTASPGQLASHLDAQAAFHLERWPQIEREFPRHFRIATAMMKQPGTVGDIASAANAPEGDVADFINGYSAAGYVVQKQTSASTNDAPGGNGKGMFSRLRQSLSRNGEAEEPEAP